MELLQHTRVLEARVQDSAKHTWSNHRSVHHCLHVNSQFNMSTWALRQAPSLVLKISVSDKG